jgi:phosphate-selective porin OprO/OprP
VHLGFAYSYQDRDTIRFRARPEAHLSPVRLVDTEELDVDAANILDFEAAAVFGPFSIQGEYIPAFVDGAGDPTFVTYYFYASYFLTGENRVYKAKNGAFARMKPNRNFLDGQGGWGAWELGTRVSGMDLDDGDVQGGELQNLTFGINWYLNPNVRFMANYVYSDRDRAGKANIFEGRFQIDF